MSITYSECVSVALFIQHAKRMRRIVLSSAACPALPHFPTLSHKPHDIRHKATKHKMCAFWCSLQLLSEIFLILRIMQRDIVTQVHKSLCKVLALLVIFQWKLNFLDKRPKNTKTLNSMTILPVGTDLFRMDRETDRHDEANSRFSQFCESA